jgi:inner membrane protein involved in colicin E2 resistance
MERALWQKIAAFAGLTLALLIPLMLIQAKIEKRQSTRAGVVRELAQDRLVSRERRKRPPPAVPALQKCDGIYDDVDYAT